MIILTQCILNYVITFHFCLLTFKWKKGKCSLKILLSTISLRFSYLLNSFLLLEVTLLSNQNYLFLPLFLPVEAPLDVHSLGAVGSRALSDWPDLWQAHREFQEGLSGRPPGLYQKWMQVARELGQSRGKGSHRLWGKILLTWLRDLREGQQQQGQKDVLELVCLLEHLGKGNLMDSR